MKIKIFITAILALTVGYFIGSTRSVREAEPVSKVETHPDLSALQQIADVDLQEYYRLKNEEERFKKADEILAKIIQIFLADLGMKVNKPQGLSNASTFPSESPAPRGQQKEEVVKAVAISKTETKTAPVRIPLSEIQTSNEIGKFLEDSKIENFDEAVKTSTPFTGANEQLRNFSGHFVGSAQVELNGATERWDIDMRLNAKTDSGGIAGRRLLKLSKNGRPFSDSSGNGPLHEEYREIPSDGDAVIIAAGPNTFLQAYYVRATDQVVGLVLRKTSVRESYKSIGNFELNRN